MLSKRSALVEILVLTFLFTLSASQRSSYGDVCNKTQKCDRRAWLACFSGKCDCMKPEEMIFETTTEKCASKAGERCKYAFEHSDGSKSFEYTPCVGNSVCSVDGFCSCGEEYYENVNATCSPSKNYSEPCDTRAKCSSRSGLVCNKGICQCSDRTSTYSLEENQCVGLAGHVCILSKCTENARCDFNKCVCNDGFFQNSDDDCSQKLDRLANCTIDDQCRNEEGLALMCVDGTCQCDPGTSLFGTAKKHTSKHWKCDSGFHQFEGDSYSQCLGKAGKPCLQGLCAYGSYCSYNTRCASGSRTCVCRPGYSQSNLGTCVRGYNEACDSQGTCLDGLVCGRDVNKCRCRYENQIYDATKKMCNSPVVGPCGANSGCVDGAECVMIKNNARGTCQCSEGFVEGTFGKCQVAFGMPCTDLKVCDVVAGLNCIDDTCQCNAFKQFNVSTKTCLGLVGSQCNLNEKNQQCVPNSRCSNVREEHTEGRCTCTTGYIVSEDYTCESEISEDENSGSVPVLNFNAVYDVETSDEKDGVD